MSSTELDTFSTFGELLRYLRRRAHLTQRELGLAVGYTDAHITRLEKGQRLPDPAVVRARFIEALCLQQEPKYTAQLLKLASAANQISVKTQSSSPTDQPASTRQTNLSIQLTDFIGRGHELPHVQNLVSERRMVTLTGTGGTGKTRLALEVGTRCLNQEGGLFTHGVWLVELASISDSAFMAQTIASALNLPKDAEHTPLEVLLTHLKSKHLLLLLDNCEHLIGACASMAEGLLSGCPHLHILATSREALRAAGETVVRVPPLAMPDPDNLPTFDRALQFDAIQLFVNRASAARFDYVAKPDDLPATARICYQLDGIPLAIELAASRLHTMSIQEIAGKLDDRFRLLTSGKRTAPTRHQTLRTLIDWSYDLLSEPERMLLERLSVFAGGWTLKAAELACSDIADERQAHDVLTLLLELVSKSLVTTNEGGNETRYGLLDTIRAYALERLKRRGGLNTARTRHAEAYLAIVQQVEPHFHSLDRRHWYEKISQERDNIRAALTWCLSDQDHVLIGLLMIGLLETYWLEREPYGEGPKWFSEYTRFLSLPVPPDVRARVLLGAGSLMPMGSDNAEQGAKFQKVAWLEEALTLFRSLDDQQGVAVALKQLGITAFLQFQYAQSQLFLEQSLTVARKLGNPLMIAQALYHLASLAQQEEQTSRVTSLLKELLTLVRIIDDEEMMAMALILQCDAAFYQREFKSAEGYAQDVLQIARKTGNIWDELNALFSIGEAARFLGDLPRARELFEELHVRAIALDAKPTIELALQGLGKVAFESNDYPRAHQFLSESLRVGRTDNDMITAFSLDWVAHVAGAQFQPKRAARIYGAAQAIREAQNRPMPSNITDEYERYMAATRDQLDEAAFMAEWALGKAMTIEQSVAYACELM